MHLCNKKRCNLFSLLLTVSSVSSTTGNGIYIAMNDGDYYQQAMTIAYSYACGHATYPFLIVWCLTWGICTGSNIG